MPGYCRFIGGPGGIGLGACSGRPSCFLGRMLLVQIAFYWTTSRKALVADFDIFIGTAETLVQIKTLEEQGLIKKFQPSRAGGCFGYYKSRWAQSSRSSCYRPSGLAIRCILFCRTLFGSPFRSSTIGYSARNTTDAPQTAC